MIRQASASDGLLGAAGATGPRTVPHWVTNRVSQQCFLSAAGPAKPRPAWALLILALLLTVATGLTQPAPVAAQEPGPSREERGPAWARLRDGVQVAATAHFDVWVPGDQALAPQAAQVADTAEVVLPTVESRMATPLADRVSLVLVPAELAPEPCEPRAAALPTRRRIVLFAGPATLDAKALPAFLAHEIGHQLTLDRWGALGEDRRLSEGVATWAAEPYWLAWRDWRSMDQAVADLLASSAIAPLAEPHDGCLVAAERDVYYSAWSSFVDYLARRYGWDRFGQALTLPVLAEDRADYAAAFGSPLEDLTAAWERTLPQPGNGAALRAGLAPGFRWVT